MKGVWEKDNTVSIILQIDLTGKHRLFILLNYLELKRVKDKRSGFDLLKAV
ncbi:MAG: hypothetical protein PVG39_14415 [Desulfobacteraceae bacterium]